MTQTAQSQPPAFGEADGYLFRTDTTDPDPGIPAPDENYLNAGVGVEDVLNASPVPANGQSDYGSGVPSADGDPGGEQVPDLVSFSAFEISSAVTAITASSSGEPSVLMDEGSNENWVIARIPDVGAVPEDSGTAL
jgi:hypothetical protein